MDTTGTRTRSEAGFSLIELMVAMGLVMLVMAGTMTALTSAYHSSENARDVIDVNNNLRIGIDLMVRDLTQVGQALPTGRVVQVPSGSGALNIKRPHPEGSSCTEWPTGTEAIPAVTPGPGCGPTINGRATDMITTLAVDAVLDAVPVYRYDLGAHTATVARPPVCTSGTAPNCTVFSAGTYVGGVDISNGLADDVRVGDLIMFTKGSTSALVYVTAINGNQTFTFATGDPMNLNQFAVALNGTVDDLASLAPTGDNSSYFSRIRMISYYLDNTLDSTTPRLIRHLNWGDPAVANNLRGRTVAFAVEDLQFNYDMVDAAGTFTNVRMITADYTTSGGCHPVACSPNQIRKANIYVAGRSERVFSKTKRFIRNALNTQVSLRSMALVDRYR